MNQSNLTNAMTMLLFIIAAMYTYKAHAMFVWGPNGAVDVQQTPNGYNIVDLNGRGITTINRSSNGYIVNSPSSGTTFINMSPEEMEEGVDIQLPVPSEVAPVVNMH